MVNKLTVNEKTSDSEHEAMSNHETEEEPTTEDEDQEFMDFEDDEEENETNHHESFSRSNFLSYASATRPIFRTRSRFDEYYRCYSFAMMAKERDGINYGGKIILPQSALAKLGIFIVQPR